MGMAKEVVRAIIALIMAGFMFYLWPQLRPDDPDYYIYGASAVVGIMTFLVLHFIGKEN